MHRGGSPGPVVPVQGTKRAEIDNLRCMNSLDRLTGFYWVARTGGYARAVRAFPYPITEPGVHQQVRRLEAELGVRLFRRAAKDRMVLTPHGRALHDVVGSVHRGAPDHGRRAQGGQLRRHAAGRRRRAPRPGAAAGLAPRSSTGATGGRRHAHRAPGARRDAQLRTGELDLVVDHLPEMAADVEAREVARALGLPGGPGQRIPPRAGPRVDPRRLTELPFLTFAADPASRSLQRRAVEALGRVGSGAVRRRLHRVAPRLRRGGARLLRRARRWIPAVHAARGIRAFRLRLAGLRATGARRVASRRSEPDARRGARRRALVAGVNVQLAFRDAGRATARRPCPFRSDSASPTGR